MEDLTRMANDASASKGLVPKEISMADGSVQTYYLQLLPAETCWKITEASIELAAPIMGAYWDGTEGFEEGVGTNMGILLAQNLKTFDLFKWSKVMLVGCTVNGKPINLLTDFLGARGLKVLKQLVQEAYKENCSDFLIGELADMGLKIPSQSELAAQKQTSAK